MPRQAPAGVGIRFACGGRGSGRLHHEETQGNYELSWVFARPADNPGSRPRASPDEIREAYHAKSKKYHPDAGGDEWAFRMVARAYEVLKTTETARSSQPWVQGSPAGAARNEGEPEESASQAAGQHRPKPDELGTVNVELVWTRYEKGASAVLIIATNG